MLCYNSLCFDFRQINQTLHFIFRCLSISSVHESYKATVSLPSSLLLCPWPHNLHTSNRSKSSKSTEKKIFINLQSLNCKIRLTGTYDIKQRPIIEGTLKPWVRDFQHKDL